MKGVVFTEFLELVESQFGFDVADRVVTKSCPFHRAYISVGTYDHSELLAMVQQLSDEANAPVPDLVHAFGGHLFQSFLKSFPGAFHGVNSTKELLLRVENTIHKEVMKLHSDAELPTFRFSETDDCFQVEYQSRRPFAILALGLIDASIQHFGESLRSEMIMLEGDPGTHALFRLRPHPSVRESN